MQGERRGGREPGVWHGPAAGAQRVHMRCGRSTWWAGAREDPCGWKGVSGRGGQEGRRKWKVAELKFQGWFYQ